MSEHGTISVKGVGNLSFPPDVTIVTFEVSALNDDYLTSVDETNSRVSNLRKQLKAAGIDPKALKSTQFNVGAHHEYIENEHVFRGWRTEHDMRIELPVDREQLNLVFDAICKSNAEAKLRVRFEVQDQAAVREAVLADATRVARRNAEAMASAAGCKLGRVQSMDYGWSEIRFGSMDYAFEDRMAMDQSSPAAPDIEAEDVQAQDSITMVWELVKG